MTELSVELQNYIADQMPPGSRAEVSDLRRMPEGWSRECFSFILKWVEPDGTANGGRQQRSQELILRRDPAGSLVYTDRRAEYMVIKSLQNSEIPVPKVWFLSADSSALGAPFMVMERIPGTSSPAVLYADDYAADREKIGREFIRRLAQLHQMDWTAMDLPFSDPPDVHTAADQAIARWRRTMQEQQLEPQPFLTQALRWLNANKPAAPRVSLLHGDYRTGNFLFQNDRLTGVVDWELASLGDPLEDLGWVFKDLWALDGKICGFFDRERTLEIYEEYVGFAVDRSALRYWEMFAEFKHTVIGLTGTRTRCDRLSDEINFAISHLYLPPLMNEQAKVMGI
jgi:aminoglycoside phosphotransferase (APT) family kinase protein